MNRFPSAFLQPENLGLDLNCLYYQSINCESVKFHVVKTGELRFYFVFLVAFTTSAGNAFQLLYLYFLIGVCAPCSHRLHADRTVPYLTWDWLLLPRFYHTLDDCQGGVYLNHQDGSWSDELITFPNFQLEITLVGECSLGLN